MVVVWWCKGWCTAAGELWQCIIVLREREKQSGFWEACENAVAEKTPREKKCFKCSGFSALFSGYLDLKKKRIKPATDRSKFQPVPRMSRQLPHVQCHLSLKCWIFTFSSLTFPLALTRKQTNKKKSNNNIWAAAGQKSSWNHPLLFVYEYH